eukprot:scaffold2041_cov251-Pinguiococcus_pyrenoidosus.AAC.4
MCTVKVRVLSSARRRTTEHSRAPQSASEAEHQSFGGQKCFQAPPFRRTLLSSSRGGDEHAQIFLDSAVSGRRCAAECWRVRAVSTDGRWAHGRVSAARPHVAGGLAAFDGWLAGADGAARAATGSQSQHAGEVGRLYRADVQRTAHPQLHKTGLREDQSAQGAVPGGASVRRQVHWQPRRWRGVAADPGASRRGNGPVLLHGRASSAGRGASEEADRGHQGGQSAYLREESRPDKQDTGGALNGVCHAYWACRAKLLLLAPSCQTACCRS